MIQLGITGGIGSGKTTVCRVLEQLHIPVYYADDESKKILASADIEKRVAKVFGNAVLDEQGNLNRAKLSAIVFEHPTELVKLTSILHPAVNEHYHAWLKMQKNKSMVAKEAAVLFESGAFAQMDKIITVYAPKELRIARTMQRNNYTRQEILNRMKQQLSEKEKIRQSDFVIYNDGKKLVIPQVLQILHQLGYNKGL